MMDDTDYLLLKRIEDYLKALRPTPQRNRLLKDIRARCATRSVPQAKLESGKELAKRMKADGWVKL